MSIAEKVQAADADLLKLKDALVEATKALEVAPDEEALLAQVEELTTRVEKAAATADALKKAEAALAARAKPIESPAIVDARHLKRAPEGLIWKHAAAKFIAFNERKSIDQVFEERYKGETGVRESYDYVAKTAVLPADTTTTGWAAELVRTDVQGFLDTLKTTSVAAALAAKGTTLNFAGYQSITVPRRNPLGATLDTPAWVGEGAAIPLTQFSFGSATINRYKLAAITTYTNELAERAVPSIEGLMRSALTEAYSQVLDAALLSSGAAVAGIRPAGLRQGITTAAGDATGGNASVIIDVKAMMNYFQTNRTGARPVLIMNNATRLALSMQQSSLAEFLWRDEVAAGRLLGMEIVSSQNVPAGVVIAIDADSFAIAMDGPMFDVSSVATVVEASADTTAPTMANSGAAGAVGTAGQVAPDGGIMVSGTTGAGSTGYVARSLWQTASTGVRMICPTSWAMLRPNSLVERTGVTW